MPIEFPPSERDIIHTVYRGILSDEELDAGLEKVLDKLRIAQKELRRVAIISTGTADSTLSSRQRQRSATWLRENAGILRAVCVGQAIVVPGTLQRGVLTAILWLGEHPVPMKACSSDDEGIHWARSMLGSTARASASL